MVGQLREGFEEKGGPYVDGNHGYEEILGLCWDDGHTVKV